MDYIYSSMLSQKRRDYLIKLAQSIKQMMPSSLYMHSMGTFKCAQSLGRAYILEKEGQKKGMGPFFKLCISSILHDYGKIYTYEDLLDIIEKNHIQLTGFEKKCKPILHSLVGGFLVERDFHITDSQILKAIRCHTVGCIKMGVVDKILFVSDKIEETRDYASVGQLRKIALHSLDRCLKEVYKNNMIYNIERNKLLHPKTSVIWNNICGGR